MIAALVCVGIVFAGAGLFSFGWWCGADNERMRQEILRSQERLEAHQKQRLGEGGSERLGSPGRLRAR